MKKIFLILIVIASLSSCYYDKTDEIHPGAGLFTTCDTTATISFANDIEPIFISTCGAQNTCHSSTSTQGAVGLANYSDVMDQVITDNLVWAITHDSRVSSPMPKGGGKLDDCSINKIIAWIDRGAPNN